MKILILGGAGFIGSHLCDKYVNEGHLVLCVDNLSNGDLQNVRGLISNPLFKFIKEDIRNKQSVFELVRDCDTVFLLSALIHVDQSLIEPYLTYQTNVIGTLNVLEACKRYDKRLIFASSSEAYGTAQYSPMDEKHPLTPDHLYGVSKVAGDRMCHAYYKSFGMPINIVRLFNCYGNRQKDSGYGGVISIFVKRALQGKNPIVYGTGMQSRDYIHISDAVRAYDLVFKSDDKSLYGLPLNFGTGKDHRIIDIARMVCEKVNSFSNFRLSPVHDVARPNDVQKLVADISLVKKKLGFEPLKDFEAGLNEYIDWVRSFKSEEWKIT